MKLEMGFCFRLLALVFFLSSFTSKSTEAYDPLDPNGNITIKWDVVSWTPDGYVAVVTIFNFQRFRHIEAPGWRLGWSWAGREVLWSMAGGQTTEQGNCSKFKGNIPLSCKKNPTVVDLSPGTPYNQQIANCCKGGVLSSWLQDPSNAASAFQVSVGAAGTTNTTVKLPRNFTFTAPGYGYICGPAKIVKPTKFLTPDGKRVTQALMTWNVTCTYSRFLAQKTPACCVALSSFYNKTIVPCPKCSCGCQKHNTHTRNCIDCTISSANSHRKSNSAPQVQCTSHMCPIQVHWHLKQNYKNFWRVHITVTNFNNKMNYSRWNIEVQHPNFHHLTRIFGFKYMPINDIATNDSAMIWGVRFYNHIPPLGNVQSELVFRKDSATVKLGQGWAFPRRVYFNGESCVMPPPDAYPYVPSATTLYDNSLSLTL